MIRAHKLALIALCAGLLQTTLASAHYPILIGDRSPLLERGDTITFTYGRGHLDVPEWTEAPKPDWIKAFTFDGMSKDATVGATKDGLTTKLKFKAKRLGDTWIVAHVPMQWSTHDLGWTETTIRTIVHHGIFRGWKDPLGLPFEMIPLTRPYGIHAGEAFRVQLMVDGKPLANGDVWAEKYQVPALKKPLPPDALVTRMVQADSVGTASITLNSPGWWVLFATHDKGELEKDGKSGTVTVQDAMWVYVEP